MNTNDLMVTELTYRITGFDMTELLVATPHAVLHYKVYRPLTPTARPRITSDVRAMSPSWWADRVNKLKGHDFYRGMCIRGSKANARPEGVAVSSMAEVLKTYDLDPLLQHDEKARNAWMTAMGHSADLAHEDDFRAAREANAAKVKEAKRTQEANAARERALADADWGMF